MGGEHRQLERAALLAAVARKDESAIAMARAVYARELDDLCSRGRAANGDLGLDEELFKLRLLASVASLVTAEREAEPTSPAATFEGAALALCIQDLYLATACAAGCHRAWDRFREQYGKLVRATMGRAGSKLDCDEIEAELLVGGKAGGGRIASYRGEGSLAGWLEVVVRRRVVAARDDPRERARLQRARLQGRLAPLEPEPPLEAMARAEEIEMLRTALADALSRLDSEDRSLLHQVFYQGKTQKEAARQAGLSEVQVCRRLQRVSKRLLDEVAADMRRSGGPDPRAGWRPGSLHGLGLGGDIEEALTRQPSEEERRHPGGSHP